MWPECVLVPCSMVCPYGAVSDATWEALARLPLVLPRGARLLVVCGGARHDDELDAGCAQHVAAAFARALPRPAPRLVDAAGAAALCAGRGALVIGATEPSCAHAFAVRRPARLSERVLRDAMVDYALARLSPFAPPASLRRVEGAAPEHDDREHQQRVREHEPQPPRRVRAAQQPA
jgi:hypothetical protein